MTGCTAGGIPYVRIGDPYKRTLVAVERAVIRHVSAAR